MSVFDTMFRACCVRAPYLLLPETANNASFVASFCSSMTLTALEFNRGLGVLDFELLAPVLTGWWINGLFFTIVLAITVLLSFLSIHIFLDSSMRSPTNVMLTAITALDLLTCLFKAPINIYVHLMEGYKELPSYTWCSIHIYMNNFLVQCFHGTSFLLNMYLSVQRFVGVKGMTGCQAVGTYKGAITAIIVSSLVSFAINSIYIITFGIEEVKAVSKKVINSSGFDIVTSCRIVSRFGYDYKTLNAVYLWLRLLVMKIPTALVLSVCNIALIRASYRTHIYRKRLVGAVGTIADSSPGSVTYRSTIMTVSGMVSISKRDGRYSSGKRCPREGISESGSRPEDINVDERRRENTNVDVRKNKDTNVDDSRCEDSNVDERRFEDINVDDRQATKAFTVKRLNCFVLPSIRNGKVTPTTSLDVTTRKKAVDRVTSPEHTGKCDGVVVVAARQATTKPLRDTHKPIDIRQQKPIYPNGDNKAGDINDLILGGEFPAGNQITGNGNIFSENNNGHTAFLAVSDSSRDTQNMRDTGDSLSREDICTQIDNVFNKTPYQVAATRSNTSVRGKASEFLEDSRKPISVSLEMAVKLHGHNYSSPSKKIKSGANSSRKGEQSNKGNMHRSIAEMRSTILLLLVTSCTLVSEVFIIVLLLFQYLTTHVLTDGKFYTSLNMANLIMIANFMIIITFPLNFIFFCGLSNAFRSALKVRINALTKKIKVAR